MRTVQSGALLSLGGASIQVLGCWLAPASAVPLLAGHLVYCLGHGIHQPCGQAGAVSELPHQAGRAVSWSGFCMMLSAFCLGQLASHFVDDDHLSGAWPMTLPILAAALSLTAIAFGWLPRLFLPEGKTP